jgi:hypothetical protein
MADVADMRDFGELDFWLPLARIITTNDFSPDKTPVLQRSNASMHT